MRLTLLFLLLTHFCNAQSSFFVGAQGSVNITTLLNKEDKNAPDGMLDKKNGIQPGYGLQFGYKYKQFGISIEPNYLQYKLSYSGHSDTANIRSFDASSRFKYYQIPLVFSYGYSINKKLSLHIGIGASYNYLSYYKEEFEGKVAILNSPTNQVISEYYFVEGKKSYDEAKGINDGKVDITLTKPWFKKSVFGVLINLHPEYHINDFVSLNLNINLQRSLSDIENKTEMTVTTYYRESGQTYTYNIKLWDENKYARYYIRSNSNFNQRPATYTMALGIGFGLRFYLSGSDINSERQTLN